MLTEYFEGIDEIPEYVLTEEDWKKIHKLSEERYQNWEWNYGKSPKFNLQHSHRFPVGTIDVRLEVNKGIIENCKIYGDFFGVGEVIDIEDRLKNVKYERASLDKALDDLDIKHYFGNITKEDFIQLIY